MLTNSQKARIGQIAVAVRRAAPLALATSFGSTLDGQSGGYSVPVDAARAILMPETGALLPHCGELPITRGGSIELPLDLATPYGTTGGVIAAWESEGVQLDQKKPKLNMTQFMLKKLVALVPVSDELLEDSDALAAWLPLALQTAATLKVNDAIVNGTGAGVPLGIRNSGSLITVEKETSQAPGSIVEGNIARMLDRSLSPDLSMWIANPSAYALITMLPSFDKATRTLAGLPILLTDACPAPGTAGDLILADMRYYIAASKTPQLNQSMHLWFDQDVTAFKLVFRMDGMPALGAPVTPPNTTASKSHFVTVATRA
jgi:HK97 family phage major capsid protein